MPKMKAIPFAIVALILTLGTLPAAAQKIDGRTGFTYQAWTSDADESASQWHLPIHLDLRANRFSMHLTAGYAYTSGDLSGDTSRSIEGFLDTQVGGAFLLPGWIGWDWMAGVDLNLPTGRTGLDERDLRMMLDPDLVNIISPGQGFNINPYLGAARSWQRWLVGIGAGYAFQGKYDYSNLTRDYDPGDLFNVAARVTYSFSDFWQLSFQGQYATTSKDKINGIDMMKKGDTWLMRAALARTAARWDITLSTQTILRGKARFVEAGGNGLSTEARNSQGQEWTIDLLGGYRPYPGTGINAGFQFLYLRPNDYETTSPLYMGRRQKYTLAVGLIQQLTDSLELDFGLKGFLMDDDPNWLHLNESREYHGWSVSAAIVHRFYGPR
ncbi:transporter [Desulfatitalea alkaliphila]|uniref:Transporter n=1 Tax=Desulfatitalea alkaliphila TaxID=2929485 RepID=A0AA41R4Y9_9BACT|nr:transporter [Desulfatitalea alkaliphila]MCJ8501846.1 transporter [Desulfatitalea alkaliphila]